MEKYSLKKDLLTSFEKACENTANKMCQPKTDEDIRSKLTETIQRIRARISQLEIYAKEYQESNMLDSSRITRVKIETLNVVLTNLEEIL